MKFNKNWFFVLIILVALFCFWYFWQQNQTPKVVQIDALPSRALMLRAEDLVRSIKPTPPGSAIFYADVATAYYDDLVSGSSTNFTDQDLKAMLDKVQTKEKALATGFKMKTGEEFWTGTNPFSPNISNYQRFIIDSNFTYQVPPPPVYKSPEYEQGLATTKFAASSRTKEQGAIINFWGGVPGTETPAGIWINVFANVMSTKENLTDKKFAFAQMILSQSLADSFMECWKIKYIYQTKRPDMEDPTISTAMHDPNFPAYVSGHSTVSFTAATVLSAMFPEEKDIWFTDATNAKNSRLWAGIHFPYDNNEGAKLGSAVGDFIVTKLNLGK